MTLRKIYIIVLVASFTVLLQNCVSKPDIPASEVEQKIFQLVNEHRVSIGFDELTWNQQISDQCREHSKNMSAGNVEVGHSGFEDRMKKLLESIPFSIAGENVAFVSGYTNPAVMAVDEWLGSSDHRVNIESDFNLTGVGVVRNNNGDYYITQIFVREKLVPQKNPSH
jgi:uncharacterized protein YkwD